MLIQMNCTEFSSQDPGFLQ